MCNRFAQIDCKAIGDGKKILVKDEKFSQCCKVIDDTNGLFESRGVVVRWVGSQLEGDIVLLGSLLWCLCNQRKDHMVIDGFGMGWCHGG